MDTTFLLGRPIFRGELLVSGRVFPISKKNSEVVWNGTSLSLRNLQQDPLNGPEKPWVSNSSIAIYWTGSAGKVLWATPLEVEQQVYPWNWLPTTPQKEAGSRIVVFQHLPTIRGEVLDFGSVFSPWKTNWHPKRPSEKFQWLEDERSFLDSFFRGVTVSYLGFHHH